MVSVYVALATVLSGAVILILGGLVLYLVEYSIVTFFLRCCGIGVRRNREPEFYAIVDPSLQGDDPNGHRFSTASGRAHQVIIMAPTPRAAYLVPVHAHGHHHGHTHRIVPRPVPVLEGFKVVPEKAKNPCGICLEPFDKDIVCAGTCMHIFHKKCIASWLAKDASQSCPLCRNTFLSANSSATPISNTHNHHEHGTVNAASSSDSATTHDS